jgi:hypothetical protein
MKAFKRIRTIAAFALVALTAHPHVKAQTWETVLDTQIVPGQYSGGADIVADGLGNVFSAGHSDDGSYHGIVLKTDTLQQNWLLSDDTNPSPATHESYVWRLGFDSNGALYSVGQLIPNSTGVASWYVRKSSDGGQSWNTVDLFQYAPGEWINCNSFAADDSGNIFVAGWARAAATISKRNTTTPGNIHWIVRKSSDGGQTWTLSDDLEGPTGGFGAAGAGFVRGAGIFVVGSEPTGGDGWRVRRSSTGNAGTWSNVDGPLARGAAQGVASDSQGNIYVTGTLYIVTQAATRKGPEVGYNAWATRKSSDGGNTWTTVDLFTVVPNKSAYAQALGTDAAGNMVVVGQAVDTDGRVRWIVRASDTTGAWRTIDSFRVAPGLNSGATGVCTDAAGNLLVSGYGYSEIGASGGRWIVRRLAPTAP